MRKFLKKKGKKDLPAISAELEQVFEDLTPKQAAWLTYYLEYADAKKAAMMAYDCKETSAKVIGSQNLTLLNRTKIMRLYLSHRGLDLNKALNKLEEGLEATKATKAAILIDKKGKAVLAQEQGLIEIPDYAERREWWDRFMALMGLKVKQEDAKTQVGVSVKIVDYSGSGKKQNS